MYNHLVVNNLDAALAAAADPTRRQILARLARGPASIHDLGLPFQMSQQAVSKHVAFLERARLVHKRRDGRTCVCTLRPAPLKEIAGWAEGFREAWEANYRRLDALLDELRGAEEQRGQARRNRKGGHR